MADFYCDHGAYGLTTNRLGLDAPVWGVPQEGDGSTKDAATASSVGSVAFASVPTTGVISVCGVTVSTTGVIGAASADAAANALATNINATATVVGSTVAIGVPQLRNLVFARGPSGGAPAGTCQIMMRIGSATLNYATNTNVGIATTFDGAPTLVQFIGGAGGCWGWFINPVALGAASSIGALLYGVMSYIQYVGATPAISDTIYVRTGGGASKTISTADITTSTGLLHTAPSRSLVFDTNTQWTGDSATGVLKFIYKVTSWNTSHSIRLYPANGTSSYKALRRGGFEFVFLTTTTAYMRLVCQYGNTTNGSLHLSGIIFRDSGVSGSFFAPYTADSSGYFSLVAENCDMIVTELRTSLLTQIAPFGGYQSYINFLFLGCTFDFNILGVADPGPLLGLSERLDTDIVFQHCEFKGFSGGYKLLLSLGASWPTSGTRCAITVDNCTGLAMPSTYIGCPSSTSFSRQEAHQIVFANDSSTTAPGLRVEDCRGVAEWVPNDPTPFPYLSATIPGTGAPWSLRLLWVQAVPLTRGRSFESPPLRMMHQLAAATRTLSLQLFIPDTIATGLVVSFGYLDTNGVQRREATEIIVSSTATWTNAASYAGYASKKMALTTSYTVASNSEITCVLQIVTVAPSAVVKLYLDPEFVVA